MSYSVSHIGRPVRPLGAWILVLIAVLSANVGFAEVALAVAPPTPLRPDPRIDGALESAICWLPRAEAEPFASGAESFRLFMIDVESWHRLSVLHPDPVRRKSFETETVLRLRKGLDAGRLGSMLSGPDGRRALTEVAVFGRRCRDHGIDPAPVGQALAANRRMLDREIARDPVSLQAVFAAYLPASGVPSPIGIEACRATGMLANRPREIDLTLADVYYLTHEIFAYSDYAMVPMREIPPAEAAYLRRILPFYTIFYLALGQVDVGAELITCMHAAGMRDTYGYREGIRVLLDRQNPDGSFGTAEPARAGDPAAYSHMTMNAMTALLLERFRSTDHGD
jgi:hypothetical protein